MEVDIAAPALTARWSACWPDWRCTDRQPLDERGWYATKGSTSAVRDVDGSMKGTARVAVSTGARPIPRSWRGRRRLANRQHVG
jgi:hypothetical protein